MFEKVLIPIELSEVDESVLQFVSGLGRYGVKEVVILHVAELKGVERPVAVLHEQKSFENVVSRSEVVKQAGLKAKPLLASGHPLDEILRVTEEESVDLIIMGTRAKGAFNELTMGSVSEMVGRKAKVPVMMLPYRKLLMLPPDEISQMAEGIFEKMLYLTDFSDVSERTLEVIKSMDTKAVGEVVVVHVIEAKELTSPHEQAVRRSTSRILSAIKEELTRSGFNARTEMIIGPVVAEALHVADEVGASCFVLGSHGRGIGEELFIGSVSQNIIRMAGVPIVITH